MCDSACRTMRSWAWTRAQGCGRILLAGAELAQLVKIDVLRSIQRAGYFGKQYVPVYDQVGHELTTRRGIHWRHAISQEVTGERAWVQDKCIGRRMLSINRNECTGIIDTGTIILVVSNEKIRKWGTCWANWNEWKWSTARTGVIRDGMIGTIRLISNSERAGRTWWWVKTRWSTGRGGGRWMPTAVCWTGRVLRMNLWGALLGDGLCRVSLLQCTTWVCCAVAEVKKDMVCLHQEFKKCTFRLRCPPHLELFIRERLSRCTIAAYIRIGVLVNECNACWSLSCMDYDCHQRDCRGGSNP